MSGETMEAASLSAVLPRAAGVITASRWRKARIRGRAVVYPDDPVWERRVNGVDVHELPRHEAANVYVETLRRQVAELSRLVPGGVKGDPGASVYTDPVSLSPEATVLEHLVELLGDDAALVFVIEPAGEDRLLLHFESRPQGSQPA